VYFSGGVAVKLRDGRTLEHHVRINSGAGERAMSVAAVVAKFMALATMALPASEAERICEAVLALERIQTRELTALLHQPA
jgi:hypothetical protein